MQATLIHIKKKLEMSFPGSPVASLKLLFPCTLQPTFTASMHAHIHAHACTICALSGALQRPACSHLGPSSCGLDRQQEPERSSQEREGQSRRTEVAMRAEAATDQASPPTPSHCRPRGSLCLLQAHPPLPCSHPHFYPTLGGLLTSPDPCSPHMSGPKAEPQETKGSSWQEGLQRASFCEQPLPLQTGGPTQPPLPRTFPSQLLP